jgi:hypothetical protein
LKGTVLELAARLIEIAGVVAVTLGGSLEGGPLPGHARDDRDRRPGCTNRLRWLFVDGQRRITAARREGLEELR